MRRAAMLLLVLAMAMLVASCLPYAGLRVGTPFNVEKVTVGTGAGIGFPL